MAVVGALTACAGCAGDGFEATAADDAALEADALELEADAGDAALKADALELEADAGDAALKADALELEADAPRALGAGCGNDGEPIEVTRLECAGGGGCCSVATDVFSGAHRCILADAGECL